MFRRSVVLIALHLSVLCPSMLTAQSNGFAPLREDGNDVPSLRRPISLDLQNTLLREALRTIMREADIELVFRADLPGLDRPVTLREPRITAAAALLRVLERSGLQAVVSTSGHVVVVADPTRPESAATGALTGAVREVGDGTPVALAEITVDGRAGRAVTDAAGRFRLRDVPAGVVTVTVRRMGYRELAQPDVVVRAGDETEISLELTTAPTPLAAVIVTPGHFGMLEQGVGSRQTLTRNEIEATPQLGDDIFRAVNRLPGVSSQDFSAAFGVRGGDHREVLLRLDGLELIEPFHLKDFESSLSIIDIGSVGGIDLITGGFGAEYGNRITGVFDMRTVAVPPGRTRTSLGVSLTNLRAASQGSLPGDRGRWLFTARRGYLDLALRLANGNTAISPTYYDMLGKIEYEAGKRTVLSAHVLHAGDRLSYVDDPNDPTLDSRYGSSYVWINLDAQPHDRANVLTVASLGRIGWERNGTRDADPRGFWTALAVDDDRSYRFAGVRQDWSFELNDRMLLKAGFDARRASADYDYRAWQQHYFVSDRVVHERYDTTMAAAAPSGTSFGAYIAHRLRPLQPLTVEVGAEYARHTHTDDSNISPRANAALSIGRTTIRAAWGRYAQAQGLHELQSRDGVERFSPADIAEHHVLSVERAFRHGLNVRLEGYQRNLDDPRPRYSNLDSTDDIFPELGGSRVLIDPERGRARGLEVALRQATQRFYWAAGYSLSNVEERIDGAWRPGPRDQRHAFSIDLSYAPDPRWRLAAAWQIHTGWPTTQRLVRADSLADGSYFFTWYLGEYHAARVPTYHRLDLRVSRQIETKRGRLAIFLDIWNLYNRENVRSYFTNVLGLRNGQPVTSYAPDGMLPRLPSFGINWEF